MPWSRTAATHVDNPVDKVDNRSLARTFVGSEAILGVFAKQPLPGRVKTRFCPPLTPLEACELYQIALDETLQQLRQAPAALTLCYAGQHAWFAEHYPALPLLAQPAGGLGERLKAVAEQLFARSNGPVLLAGSDSPDLPLAWVGEALALLVSADVVTIPCRDGGYALIGLRRPQPQLFDEIPWSTPGVLAATRDRARRLGLDYREVGEWEDLDDLPALQRLVARSPASATARHAATVLLRHL